MISIFFLTLISYLLGSISGSMIMGKFRNVDIRKLGSGNAGGTNAFRTQGFLFAFPVILIDIGKGYIAAEYFNSLNFFDTTNLINANLIFGSAAVVGHCFPIFHNFKGGKGAGTALGVLISILPSTILPALIIWILSLILTGFVGFSTILAAITVSIISFIKLPFIHNIQIMCLFISTFIVFMHRSNIIRMIKGEENQFKKIMLFKK
tara:strand:- start:3299 stop:3919 length:621 start_codon:yes stop_codon:yes gene_type:complete